MVFAATFLMLSASCLYTSYDYLLLTLYTTIYPNLVYMNILKLSAVYLHHSLLVYVYRRGYTNMDCWGIPEQAPHYM